MKKVMMICVMALMVTSAQAVTTSNQLTNPGAESGMTGWTATSGIAAVANQVQGWGTTLPHTGSYFFSMHEAASAPAEMSQEIDLTGLPGVLVSFDASCWLQTQLDTGELEVVFKDGSDAVVGTYSTGIISYDYGGGSEDPAGNYDEFTLSDGVPADAEKAICTLYGYLDSGTKINAMYDDVELTIDYELATIEKDMVDEGDLGDIITVTLTVDNPYDEAIKVEDVIPDGLKYIPPTFEVDSGSGSVPVVPTVDGSTISTFVDPGEDIVITFDVQVVGVECEEVDVTNTANVRNPDDGIDGSDDVEITLYPYEGFDKVVGRCARRDPESEDPPPLGYILCDWDDVPMLTDVHWLLRIELENISGDSIITMGSPVVTDNLGGDLEMHLPGDSGKVFVQAASPLPGIKKQKGKSDKLHLIWDADQDAPLGDLADNTSQPLYLELSTDINPGQKRKDEPKNEYTSEGWHDLNSGATLKFIDVDGTGFQLSAHTCPLPVWAE